MLCAIGVSIWQRYIDRPIAESQFKAIICLPGVPTSTVPSPQQIAQVEQIVRRYPGWVRRRKAMQWAAAYADVELCRFFLDHGALAERKDGGLEPIYFAVENNRIETVKLLIARGVDPGSPDAAQKDDELGGLMWTAAIQAKPEMCRLLVQHGAFAVISPEFQRKVLIQAFQTVNLELIELYLKQGVVFRYTEDVSLESAVGQAIKQWSTPTHQQAVDEIIVLLKKYDAIQRVERGRGGYPY